MKKKTPVILIIFIMVLASNIFIACSSADNGQSAPITYTIMYSDDSGSHTITVEKGALYHIDNIPSKEGYDFMGLYDAAVGGTQYVGANGVCLSAFNDSSNLVLFAQFKAKAYTVVLNYGGADVTGDRQFNVSYGDSLPELPKNLSLPHSEFSGWYTKENCGGTQIADKYGLLPIVSVMNYDNFTIGENGYITLYAGFEAEKFTVTFHYGDDIASEEMQIGYGTKITDVVTETRKDGKAVLSWSKSSNRSDVFEGKITDSIVLYAVEWAPYIDFDSKGGEAVNTLVAKAGSAITLPQAERDNYKFAGWTNINNQRVDITTMPATSTKLYAAWQAIIKFDTNGGNAVKEISETAGTAITLPTPEREGYIFAGWYDKEKQLYSTNRMPAISTKLKAGWYKEKIKNKTILTDGASSALIYWGSPSIEYTIELGNEIPEIDWNSNLRVKYKFYADLKHNERGGENLIYATKEHFYFYSKNEASDANLMAHIILDHGQGVVNQTYTSMSFELSVINKTDKLFIALCSDRTEHFKFAMREGWAGWQMTNFWVEICYPDTSELFL